MSKMEDAGALVATGTDGERPAAERLSALTKANDLRKELKVGWAKLGAPAGFNFGAELSELQDLVAAEANRPEDPAATPDQGDAEKPLELTPPSDDEPDAPKVDRGGIGRLVNLLLTTTADDYATIVGKVKAQYPQAKTTARSVASVAADLRRAGADVPTRRKAKAAAAQ